MRRLVPTPCRVPTTATGPSTASIGPLISTCSASCQWADLQNPSFAYASEPLPLSHAPVVLSLCDSLSSDWEHGLGPLGCDEPLRVTPGEDPGLSSLANHVPSPAERCADTSPLAVIEEHATVVDIGCSSMWMPRLCHDAIVDCHPADTSATAPTSCVDNSSFREPIEQFPEVCPAPLRSPSASAALGTTDVQSTQRRPALAFVTALQDSAICACCCCGRLSSEPSGQRACNAFPQLSPRGSRSRVQLA